MGNHIRIYSNIVHLIYPLKLKGKAKNILETLQKNNWDSMYCLPNSSDKKKKQLKNIFPKTIDTRDCTKSIHEGYKADDLYQSYFHPSIQETLFHGEEKDRQCELFAKHIGKTYLFRFEEENSPKESDPFFQFEWIASEIYRFGDSYYYIARVSLLENITILNGKEQEKENSQMNYSQWMQFASRIRQNYQKYGKQKGLIDGNNHRIYLIDDVIENLKGVFGEDRFSLSSLSFEESYANNGEKKKTRHVEPNAFIYGLVQVSRYDFLQATTQENRKQQILNQAVMLDDCIGESGGNDEFMKAFNLEHLYTRWENKQTYYSGISYGAVTIFSEDSEANYNARHKVGKKSAWRFADIVTQHHCREYLLIYLLQIYYRDELREINGLYSRLKGGKEAQNECKVKEITDKYYNLNQHFFFEQISSEIQGIELWQFYQRVLEVKSLYGAVKHGIDELNQRVLQVQEKRQNIWIGLLTIATLMVGILGMNIFDTKLVKQTWIGPWIENGQFSLNIIICIPLALIVVILFYLLWKGIRKTYKILRKNIKKILSR